MRKKALTNYVAYPTKFSEYLLSGLRVITTKNIGSYMDANKYNSILVDVDNIDYKDVFNQINKKFSSRKEIRRNYVEVLYNKQIHELFKK